MIKRDTDTDYGSIIHCFVHTLSRKYTIWLYLKSLNIYLFWKHGGGSSLTRHGPKQFCCAGATKHLEIQQKVVLLIWPLQIQNGSKENVSKEGEQRGNICFNDWLVLLLFDFSNENLFSSNTTTNLNTKQQKDLYIICKYKQKTE